MEKACISSSAAICAAADKIRCGQASAVIAGGVETFSDVPIRLTRPMRQKLITMPKAMKKGGPMVSYISAAEGQTTQISFSFCS